MSWISAWRERLAALLLGHRRDAVMDEELRFHLEKEAEYLMRQEGLDPEQARRQARIRFGGVSGTRDAVRDARGARVIESFVRDIRQGSRVLSKHCAFTVVAILSLAIGIGANTAIFSVVRGVLLQPLPYPDSDRIVTVAPRTQPTLTVPSGELSFEDRGFWHFVSNNRAFAAMGGVDVFSGANGMQEWNLTGEGVPLPVDVARMTAGAFEILGLAPERGRLPTAAEDVPGGPSVLLISDSLWRGVFGADPDIVGRRIYLNDAGWEVIGVMPAAYAYPSSRIDVWMPFQLDPASGNVGRPGINAIARLAPGETVESATADAERLIAGYGDAGYPSDLIAQRFTGAASVRTLKEGIVGDSRRPLIVLLAMTGFILLIASSNVANLMQARAEAKTLDMAVRMALGAGRRRLVQSALVEGLLLGVLGGAAGVSLAFLGVRALLAVGPASIPRPGEIGIDATVLVFSALISVASGLLVALWPAMRTGSPRALESLQGQGRGAPMGREPRWARNGLVIAQVSLALALFVGSALMVRSYGELTAVDIGFDPADVLTFRVSPSSTRYPEPESVARFYDELRERLQAVPGIREAGGISFLPLTGGIGGLGGPFLDGLVEEFLPEDESSTPTFVFRRTTPGYFEAMGIPLVEGRTFTSDDHNRRLGTLIISRSLKERYWPGVSALGKRIAISGGPAEVVGVVGNVHDTALDVATEAVVYKPMLDVRGGNVRAMTIAVRSSGPDPLSMVDEVRAIIASIDPDLPISDIEPLSSIVGDSLSRTSFTMAVLAIGAATALILGAIGIYGVIAYGVSRRRGEIGLRQALGADRSKVLKLVLRDGIVMAGAGVVLGLPLSAGLAFVLSSLLYEVSPYDPISFFTATVVLLSAALLASAIPAVRAARIDPAVCFREQG